MNCSPKQNHGTLILHWIPGEKSFLLWSIRAVYSLHSTLGPICQPDIPIFLLQAHFQMAIVYGVHNPDFPLGLDFSERLKA